MDIVYYRKIAQIMHREARDPGEREIALRGLTVRNLHKRDKKALKAWMNYMLDDWPTRLSATTSSEEGQQP